jgi:3-(3-hydroxy-phenyl)propionate hydroxylase
VTEHAVVIAGGGPTGLMLASELVLAGIDVVVVERRTSQALDGSRSGGLHSRTIEELDQRGIAERFVSAGQTYPSVGFAGITLDITDFPTRHNYVLGLWLSHFERILADRVDEIGVRIIRGSEVVRFAQDESGVEVQLSGDTSLRADYLVGCDGGRSLVRKGAGIDFPGLEPSTSWMLAEVEMDEEPEFGFRRDSAGRQHAIGRRQEGEPIRIVLTEQTVDQAGEPTMDELREVLVAVYGTDYGLRTASWISRFTDMSRQAASYRNGRVLLAGDAAHVHPPQGGQGLNIGVQDAMNLGWKLAQVVNGATPDRLLDGYHAERHPVGARVLHNTMAQVALSTPGERHQALRETMTELLGMDEPRRRFAGMMSGLDVRYDLGEGHPLLGRRMPDLDLVTSDGKVRVFALLHDGRAVLLNFDEPWPLDPSPWSDRVLAIDAVYDGRWELPVLGDVEAPAAVLIRPDGYVAWVGDGTETGLREAMNRWFGPR